MSQTTTRPERFFGQGTPAATGARRLERWASNIKERVGAVLNSIGIPGFVRPIDTYDPITNAHLEVRISSRFTVLSVDGKDYYFRRLDGRYDGSGMALECGYPTR